MTDEITSVREGALLLLGINRPARKNALTGAMYLALAAALLDAQGSDAIRAVVIHGTENEFCAGNDVGDFAKARDSVEERPSARFMQAVLALGKPLVAAVNGPAVGIGATMLLHCDLVYAGTAARFSFPFVKLGLCPEFASTIMLPATLGRQRAAELLLLGESFGATAAQEMGLVSAVLEPGEVLAHATKIGQRLCELSPKALQATKSLIRGDTNMLSRRVREEDRHFAALLQTPEAQGAVASFLKRSKQP